MDTLGSLNGSLPRTSSRQTRTHPASQELLQAFKSAALSVTNLYKTAASDQAQARAQGYQDAVEELLTFLDTNNLGLGDGEGWRVRQWATERFDPKMGHSPSDGEDEMEEDKRERSSSPVAERNATSGTVPQSSAQHEDDRNQTGHQSAPALSTGDNIAKPSQTSEAPPFTFQAGHTLPFAPDQSNLGTSHDHPTVRVEVFPRHRRSRGREQPGWPSNRTSPPLISLGQGAGAKRKQNFGEFFDIDSLLGNGKRARQS